MELPGYLQIEPVGQCNLRCQMCPITFRQDGPPYGPPAFMEYETFCRILGDFRGLKELHLQGLGEPMMHPRFFDMVRYASARGVRVTTNTNATLLNGRRAGECVTSGLECLHASVDGATAGTFERIRVRAKFSRIVANLETFRDIRRQGRSLKPRLHIVFVAMRQNLEELPELVRLARELEAEEVFVQQLCHDFGEATLPEQYRSMRAFVDQQALLQADHRWVEEVFSRAREAAATAGLRLRLPRVEPKPHPPGTPGPDRCSWPWTGGYISYQGYMMPCCMVSTPDRINFGNVRDQGVMPIWNNAAFSDFRAQLASDDPPEICRSCSIYQRTF
jgi:radical SAM protein with 4Fe4S-binding SPASM domain